MVKILGFLDIGIAFMLLARAAGWDIPSGMMVLFLICFIGKTLISVSNFFSWLDMAAAIIFIIGGFVVMPPLVLVISAIIMGLKGIVSMF